MDESLYPSMPIHVEETPDSEGCTVGTVQYELTPVNVVPVYDQPGPVGRHNWCLTSPRRYRSWTGVRLVVGEIWIKRQRFVGAPGR